MADALLDSQLAAGEIISKVWRNTIRLGKDNLTIEILQSRLALLETYWKDYVERHQQLFPHRAAYQEENYFTQDIYSDVECSYIDIKTKLRNALSESLGAVQEFLGAETVSRADLSPRANSTSASLPPLKLPKFSGRQEDWDTFKELFCSLVKDDPLVSPVRKLQHLLTCVEGEAARRVSNFQLIGANFEVAWQTLERRYDNKRLRLSMQLNRLIGMKPATSKSVAEINRLLDTTNDCKRALQSLGRPVDYWDDWFVQLIVYNLDASTREDWEKSLEGTQTFPTYATLVDFLEGRTHSLDAARCSDQHFQRTAKQKSSNIPSQKHSTYHFKTVSAHLSNSPAFRKSSMNRPGCAASKGDHYIGFCPSLLQKDPTARLDTVERLKLCHNCLRPRHATQVCTNSKRCRYCNREHHSILHVNAGSRPQTPATAKPSTSRQTTDSTDLPSASVNSYTTTVGNTTVLATAQVVFSSSSGECIQARALIDPCAEGSFITEKIAQALCLRKIRRHTSITGVGAEITAMSTFCTTLSLKSKTDTDFCFIFSAAILPRLTQLLPKEAVNRGSWKHIEGLRLADPDFSSPAPVDCILGGEVFPAILLDGVRSGPSNTPVAQNTRLGWILTGPISGLPANVSVFSTTLSVERCPSTSELLRKFWEIEEILTPPPLTLDEDACERHFERTHCRNDDGRYVVRLPFREQPLLVGSRAPAFHRLLSMERKLSRDEDLRLAYAKFLQEYEKLHHMIQCKKNIEDCESTYFLPHHAVIKQDGSRKLRVVFDASQTAANGNSLNHFLHTGPKLQLDITTVLTRWRQFQYVFTADIVKMFRQILIQPEDTKCQLILWRASPDHPLQVFRLLTVTYGTACAPYLAIKVLRQLAEDEGERFPLGAQILRSHTYVDDALAGGDTLDEARQARSQLQQILASAGMQLDKWSANSAIILPENCSIPDDISFHQEEVVSTLGLRWSPQSDMFHFQVQRRSCNGPATKRAILREVARLYDPLGWLAPVTVRAKVLLQLLWITGKEWDEPVDSETRCQWDEFCEQLPMLELLRIPRWFRTSRLVTWTLHGFSDASEKAYAAAAYIVVGDEAQGQRSVLIAAKTKVAPIKTLSIPRLELCGALLLARLLRKVKDDLGRPEATICCWTDSQVVLAWLQGRPGSWHTFVANRVSQILTLHPDARWGHVRSAANPADLATRGVTPEQLLHSELWWSGPALVFAEAKKYVPRTEFATDLERKHLSSAFHAAPADNVETLFQDFLQ